MSIVKLGLPRDASGTLRKLFYANSFTFGAMLRDGDEVPSRTLAVAVYTLTSTGGFGSDSNNITVNLGDQACQGIKV